MFLVYCWQQVNFLFVGLVVLTYFLRKFVRSCIKLWLNIANVLVHCLFTNCVWICCVCLSNCNYLFTQWHLYFVMNYLFTQPCLLYCDELFYCDEWFVYPAVFLLLVQFTRQLMNFFHKCFRTTNPSASVWEFQPFGNAKHFETIFCMYFKRLVRGW